MRKASPTPGLGLERLTLARLVSRLSGKFSLRPEAPDWAMAGQHPYSSRPFHKHSRPLIRLPGVGGNSEFIRIPPMGCPAGTSSVMEIPGSAPISIPPIAGGFRSSNGNSTYV
jgi:hypothetical protein